MRLKFYTLILLGIFVLGVILLISAAYAATFIDENQSEFDAGTYSNTTWAFDHIELSSGQTSGTFTSQVFDAGAKANWSWLQWSENLVFADKLIAVDGAADVWKSTDSGVAWTLVKDDYNGSDINNADDMEVDSLGNLYILHNQNIWKSTDSGLSWTKVNDDYNGSEWQNGKRIASDTSNNLYIAEGDEDIWQSTDSGETWTKQAENINGGNGNVFGMVYISVFTDITFAARSGNTNPPTDSFSGFLTDPAGSSPGVSDARYFQYQAFFSSDDDGVTPELSDVTITYSVLDTSAPDAVLDLSLSNASDSAITVSWTAPGDDESSGTATSYDLRYSTSEITSENWSSANQVFEEPTPSAAGSSESMAVSDLLPNTTYYFALKTSDEVPNESGLSNVPNLSTTAGPAVKFVVLDPTDGTVDNSIDITVQAQDDSGNINISYQNDVTLSVDGSAAGGGLMDIINGVGMAAIADILAETVNLSLIDTESTGLNVSSTQNVVFAPGAVSQFILNDPGDTTAGERLGYTVTRKDQFGNAAASGVNKVYLYALPVSSNKKFYSSDSGDNIITSVDIIDGSSFANFWYYDQIPGTYTITASDNPAESDGAEGIDDWSDSLAVNKRDITVTAAHDSKVHDGTVSSAGVPTITSGSLMAGDTATWTQTFDNANVGTGKTLIPTGSVSDGNNGNNYNVTFVNDTTGIITSSGGGGGGGGGYITPEPVLIISELQSPSITTDTLTLTWTTNFPSSSYVIYSVKGEPRSLDMTDNTGTPPKYGYSHASAEYNINPKGTSHSVTVAGLEPATTYYFRTVSRGSLAISGEYKATTPTIARAQTFQQATGGEVSLSETAGDEITEGGKIISVFQAEQAEQAEQAAETQQVNLPATPEETINPSAAAGLKNQPAAVSQPESNRNLFAAFAAGFREILGKTFNSKIFIFVIIIAIIVFVFLFFAPTRWFKKK